MAAPGPRTGYLQSYGNRPGVSGSKAHALFIDHLWKALSATMSTDGSFMAMGNRMVVEAVWERSEGLQEP